MKQVRAIIADDEQALRDHLKQKLSLVWPELAVIGEAQNGEEALALIRETGPDIAFLDIQMPGMTGIDVVREARGRCLFVFVTAYDTYAIEAFEQNAIDYLLKPVSDERLIKTVKRLKERLTDAVPTPEMTEVLDRIASAMRGKADMLQWIKAQHKDGVRLISVVDIYYFKASDKYTVVRTRDGEFLIRKTIKDLEGGLDPAHFWRVNRGALVNARAISAVKRSLLGTLEIRFKDIPDQLTVSRAYVHLFKQM